MTSHEQCETPCPICQQQSYTWGKIELHGRFIAFPDSPFWRRFLLPTNIPLRRCNACGNLQMFTDEAETKK